MIPIGPAPVMSTSSPTRVACRAVDGVAERVEDRAEVGVDVVRLHPHVGGWHHHEVRERTVPVDAHGVGADAHLPAPGAAVAAPAADDVPLHGDALAHPELVTAIPSGHPGADLHDLAVELVTDRHRRGVLDRQARDEVRRSTEQDDGIHLPGVILPRDAYSARGWGGHFLLVLPSLALVVVHRAQTETEPFRTVSKPAMGLLTAALLDSLV